MLLKKNVSEGNVTEEYAYSVSKRFYHEIIACLETWSCRFLKDVG